MMKFLRWLMKILLTFMRGIGWSGAVAAGIALLVAAGLYMQASARLEKWAARNAQMTAEIAKLDKQVVEVAALQDKINRIVAHRQLAARFNDERLLAARLIDQVARLRPEGVYLNTLTQAGPKLVLDGAAGNYGDVAALVGKLGESTLFDSPRLFDVHSESGARIPAYPVRFKVGVTVRGQVDPDPAKATAAPAPTRQGDPR